MNKFQSHMVDMMYLNIVLSIMLKFKIHQKGFLMDSRLDMYFRISKPYSELKDTNEVLTKLCFDWYYLTINGNVEAQHRLKRFVINELHRREPVIPVLTHEKCVNKTLSTYMCKDVA